MSINANVSAGWNSPVAGHEVGKVVRVVARRVAAGAYAAGIAFLVGFLIINGPAMRAAAERHEADQIDLENKVYCQKLGMDYGTDRFAACAGHLAEVRRLHGDRLSESIRGFF